MEICTNDTDRFDTIKREFLIWRLRVWGHTKAPLTKQDPAIAGLDPRILDPCCAHRTDSLKFYILEIKPAEENKSQWSEVSCPNVKTNQTKQEEERVLEVHSFGFLGLFCFLVFEKYLLLMFRITVSWKPRILLCCLFKHSTLSPFFHLVISFSALWLNLHMLLASIPRAATLICSS